MRKKRIILACIRTFLIRFDSVLVWCTAHFYTSVIDLDLDSRSQEWKKAKNLPQLSQTCWSNEPILILSCPFNLQGREPNFYAFVNTNFTLACIHTFTDRFLLNLVWWRRPLSPPFWYQFLWPWFSFKVTVVQEIKNCCPFSRKFKNPFGWNSVCFPNLLVCWSS